MAPAYFAALGRCLARLTPAYQAVMSRAQELRFEAKELQLEAEESRLTAQETRACSIALREQRRAMTAKPKGRF